MIRPVGEGTLTAPDGRKLSYVARGAEAGFPVIVSHGTPGSRYARHPDEGLYERHGVTAVADELGFERFGVVGGSGGAPHALACGALLADRVVRVGALVTPAPPDAENFDFFDGLAELNVKEFGAALEGREAIEAFLEPYVEGVREDVDAVIEQILTELPEVDRELASRPEFRAVMKQSFTEAVRQGSRGWADDDLAFAKPWGFDLEDVTVETRVWQGELDVLTPRPHGEYVASRLPNARFELLAGGGHFLDKEWALVLDWLAAAPAAA